MGFPYTVLHVASDAKEPAACGKPAPHRGGYLHRDMAESAARDLNSRIQPCKECCRALGIERLHGKGEG